MGYSNAYDVEQEDLLNDDEMALVLDEDEFGGQTLDDNASIEETQSLVDEFEETLRS